MSGRKWLLGHSAGGNIATTVCRMLLEEAEDYARTLMRTCVEVTGKRFPRKRHAFASSEADGQKHMIDYLDKEALREYISNV